MVELHQRLYMPILKGFERWKMMHDFFWVGQGYLEKDTKPSALCAANFKA
jgi:hypothetical protein